MKKLITDFKILWKIDKSNQLELIKQFSITLVVMSIIAFTTKYYLVMLFPLFFPLLYLYTYLTVYKPILKEADKEFNLRNKYIYYYKKFNKYL